VANVRLDSLPDGWIGGAELTRDHAFELAIDQDATVHVLHVVEAFSPAASLHEMITERGTELVESVAELGQERGIPVEPAVREGYPAEVIVEYAQEEDIDVIAMPTHGRPELTKAIIGSVIDKVIRTGDVPVTVIKLSE
jgi:nucleotide-binding universal stress UspA family protein